MSKYFFEIFDPKTFEIIGKIKMWNFCHENKFIEGFSYSISFKEAYFFQKSAKTRLKLIQIPQNMAKKCQNFPGIFEIFSRETGNES